jgi:peptidylprolyl isomerase
MAQAKQGDTVRVHYTGRLTSGEVFDSSECKDDGCGCGDGSPLEFTIGGKQVIPGFEAGVLGLAPGEAKTITIPVEDAYGPHNPDMVAVVARDQVPPHIEVALGNQLELTQEDGQSFNVVITDVTDTTITLDANHPLAGRELIFDLKLVAIV